VTAVRAPTAVSCALAVLLLVAVPAAASADAAPQDAAARTVRIYRCTDPFGNVTLQNDVPCPKGTEQQQLDVDVPPPLPAYAPQEPPAPAADATAGDADASTDVAEAPTAARAGRGPPPLHACRRYDGVEELTEDATPQERCKPLPIVGLDGSAVPGAAACEKVVDTCSAVPPDQLCQAWRRRVDEAAFRWKFAGAAEDDARRHEYEALAATLARSDCAAR